MNTRAKLYEEAEIAEAERKKHEACIEAELAEVEIVEAEHAEAKRKVASSAEDARVRRNHMARRSYEEAEIAEAERKKHEACIEAECVEAKRKVASSVEDAHVRRNHMARRSYEEAEIAEAERMVAIHAKFCAIANELELFCRREFAKIDERVHRAR